MKLFRGSWQLLVTALLTLSFLGSAQAGGSLPKPRDLWLIRARAIGVVPDETSTTISVIGGKVNRISNQVVPELDISYFFTRNIAAELILATTRHSVQAANTTLGTISLGRVWLLPPILTLQYHFDVNDSLKPYIGAGVNYTIFYNESPRTVTSTHFRNSFGWALQAGVDYNLNEHWLINLDVKKLFLDTRVTTTGPAVRTTATIDPWIFGLGVGYHFG